MVISDKDKEFLINTAPSAYTYSFITSLIGDRYDPQTKKVIPSRFSTRDTFTLEANEYINTTKIETTVGSLIFNKVVVEQSGTQDILGYVNDELNKGKVEAIYDKLSFALTTEKITRKKMTRCINLMENLGMRLHAEIAGSFTSKTFKPLPSVMKRKDELFKKYEKDIEAGNVNRVIEIENELLDLAKKELKGDPGMMLYNSKANASFDNNYKNIFVMKGTIYDPGSGKNHIVKNNLSEGIEIEDMPAFATDIVSGAYPKAVGTAVSGYLSKKILATLQSSVLSDDVIDCGSKQTIEVTIDNPKDYMFRYIVDDGKLILLDERNMEKYKGKTVHMRTLEFCTNKELCQVCAGTAAKNQGIKNIGLTGTLISGKFTNLSMKKFHDSTVKLTDIKPEDLFMS